MSAKDQKLGALVRELRERQGLTQPQLAVITLLEAGQHANLSPSAVGRLARALGVSSKQLIEAGD
jgi:transcriptional regulator with XRE-family HTH domain